MPSGGCRSGIRCARGLPSPAPFICQLFEVLLLGHLSKDAGTRVQGYAIYKYAMMSFLVLYSKWLGLSSVKQNMCTLGAADCTGWSVWAMQPVVPGGRAGSCGSLARPSPHFCWLLYYFPLALYVFCISTFSILLNKQLQSWFLFSVRGLSSAVFSLTSVTVCREHNPRSWVCAL